MGTLDSRGLHPLPGEQWFDDLYYAQYDGHRRYQRDDEWLALFDRIAARIATDIQPQTVLDAGCALGLLVETLRHRGVDAFGVVDDRLVQVERSWFWLARKPWAWISRLLGRAN